MKLLDKKLPGRGPEISVHPVVTLFYNLGQNIWRLFQFLAELFFTTSETELDYYRQKVSVRVASQVAELLKT